MPRPTGDTRHPTAWEWTAKRRTKWPTATSASEPWWEVTCLASAGSTPVHKTCENGKTGPGGDRYSGLDSFGRVVEPSRIMGNVPKQNASYGYDLASNRQWRRDDLAHDLGGVETAAVTNPSGVIHPADDQFGDSDSERQVYMALILRPMSATNLN